MHPAEMTPGLCLPSCLQMPLPPTIGKPFRWDKTVSLLDYENNGYTM